MMTSRTIAHSTGLLKNNKRNLFKSVRCETTRLHYATIKQPLNCVQKSVKKYLNMFIIYITTTETKNTKISNTLKDATKKGKKI